MAEERDIYYYAPCVSKGITHVAHRPRQRYHERPSTCRKWDERHREIKSRLDQFKQPDSTGLQSHWTSYQGRVRLGYVLAIRPSPAAATAQWSICMKAGKSSAYREKLQRIRASGFT